MKLMRGFVAVVSMMMLPLAASAEYLNTTLRFQINLRMQILVFYYCLSLKVMLPRKVGQLA